MNYGVPIFWNIMNLLNNRVFLSCPWYRKLQNEMCSVTSLYIFLYKYTYINNRKSVDRILNTVAISTVKMRVFHFFNLYFCNV